MDTDDGIRPEESGMTKISRRSFTLLASAGILGGEIFPQVLPSSNVAPDDRASFTFPYGAHVYREPHLPLEQIRRDLPILKRLGFTMIKIQEVWGYDERHEGQIDLSNVSQVVSDARQNHLRVYFGVTMENPPAWFWKKFPDAVMVYEDGQPNNDPTPYVLPADGKPGPCWHHQEGREAAIRFIEAVGREIGKYDNIQVWNIFQEIGLWPTKPGHLGLCYCRNTLSAFREWLRKRYSSIRQLNDTWEAIDPPRVSPKVPPAIDWRYFMDDAYLSFVLNWKAAAFRRADPMSRPILAHVSSVTLGSTREWRYAEQVDIFGSSCYPGWTGPPTWDANHGSAEKPLTDAAQDTHETEDILIRFDQLRSSKRGGEIWTAELQGGPITEGLNRRRVPSSTDIRRWVLSGVAAGSRGICFWNHRPEIFWEEGYGFSLLDWGADSSLRAEEAGRLARALNSNAELFTRGEHPQPTVAIVLNEDLYHWAEGSLHDFREHLQYTVTGIWKALWRKGIPARFVESTAIPDNSGLKALILPFPFALSQATITDLRKYVQNGGTLISEACPGRFSNYGIGFDGAMAPGVAELFGARHLGVYLVREPDKGSKWTNWEFSLRDSREYRPLTGVGEFSSYSVFPAFQLQTLALTTATPILVYGNEVAGCENQLGKGRAYLVGTLLGHAGPAYSDWRNADFIAALLARAGVATDRVGDLLRRRRTLGKRAAWFLFNPLDKVVEESLSLEGFTSAQDLLREEVRRVGDTISIQVAPNDIRCILLER
jgi:beta-galactosidase